MFPRVVEASFVKDGVLRIQFQDGSVGNVDLSDRFFGEMFEPLKNPSFFRQFRVHPDLHTVSWPNGADFAPEFLLERLQSAALK
jgi:hypothetical protein